MRRSAYSLCFGSAKRFAKAASHVDHAEFRELVHELAVGIKPDEPHKLTISRPNLGAWADIRAGCQHPKPSVRIATRLAILGTWLGVAAFLAALVALVEAEPIKSWLKSITEYSALLALIVSALFGMLCVIAAKGVRRKVPTGTVSKLGAITLQVVAQAVRLLDRVVNRLTKIIAVLRKPS